MPYATPDDTTELPVVADPIRSCLGIDRATLRDLVADLYRCSAGTYWCDLVVSLLAGYAALVFLPVGDPFSLLAVALYCVATLAFYRAVIFTHEISHKTLKKLPLFRFFWIVFCGTPALLPSYFYDDHRVHHAKRTYGTLQDGEYLAYSRLPIRYKLLLLGVSPLVFPVLYFRFLVLTPLMIVFPALQRFVLGHASSLVIDPGHRRPVPGTTLPMRWLLQELACFGWCVLIAIGLGTGIIPVARLVEGAMIMSGVFALNALRTLLAHEYAGDRREMAFHEQVLDSCDYPGRLSELWAPVGLRFHALHHLLPNLPYHSLSTAHRRLMAVLPPDAPYRNCQKTSLISGICSVFVC
jgi:fatty acid desaturase